MDIENEVYPLSRYWYGGSFRFYYAYGNTPPQDFLQNCSGVDNPAILVLGCGDIRSCFYSLWKSFDNKGPAGFSGVEFVLNDISAAVLARDILFLYLCLHLPGEETALKKWLSGMWAIWYCHELFPDHNKLLNDSLHVLCKYSNDWSNENNSLYPLVKFSSPTTLKEVQKIWMMWFHKKVKCKSVKEMHSSRKALFSRSTSSTSSFVESSTKIPFEQFHLTKKSGLQESEVLSYVEKGSVYAEIVLDSHSSLIEPTIVNVTLFEREDAKYNLHYNSLPFRCYFHTVEFKNGLVMAPMDTLLVPDKNFNSFPLLANSVQQFTMWIQSTHHVLCSSGCKVSFTFNCSHALTFCYELEQSMFPKFDLIYTSNLMDHLTPPNLILSAIPLLKDSGLLFTSTLYKQKFGTLNDYITTSLGLDCKFLPIILGIRCINHEGNGYASPVTVQPCPWNEKREKYIFQEDVLIWEKLMPDTVPLIGKQLPDTIVKALLNSVQIFVYPLIMNPTLPLMMNNFSVETAVKYFQVLMSNVCAEFSPHFWQPLSDAMQVPMKPYLKSMQDELAFGSQKQVLFKPYLLNLQTQLILHGIHMHLTVNEKNCPVCLKVPVTSFLGLFCTKWVVQPNITPSFMAIVHKESTDKAPFLCDLAVSGRDVHIFDCVSSSSDTNNIHTLQLLFYAPLDLVKQGYKVTTAMSLTSHFGNFASKIATQSLKDCLTFFSSFIFFQPALSGANFNHILKSFGVITSHGSDGDSCDTEIDLCPEVISRFGVDKIEPKKVSSNILQLSFGESTCQLKYPFPVAYDSIRIRLRRKKGSVLVHCPRAFQDFIDEKPLFAISPDKAFSLFPLTVNQDTISSLSHQQFTMQELKSIQSFGQDSIELPSLVKVKQSILNFFQDKQYFFQIIEPAGKVSCLILVNNRLFNYEDRIPVVDLAFCFIEDMTSDTLLPSWVSIPPQQLCSIQAEETECKLMKQVFLYFAKRTNADCSLFSDSNCCFNWLIENKVQQYFTRAVISFLLCDVDHFSQVLKEQPKLLQELFPAIESDVTKEKCDYCDKLSTGCLKKCSKCRGVKYCDEKCQRAHWKTHKSVCRRSDSSMTPSKENSTASRPFPIARFWHSGDFRYYYAYGNTPAEDFLENCSGISEPQILSLGCGDIRSCFYTLWKHFDSSISQAPKRFQGVHFVLNDYSIPVQARNIIFLYLCLHLPSKIEERKRWLCAMWAIWYCHELHSQHQSVLDNCLRALLKYSESLDQWRQADNPLSHLVKFMSPAVLSEISQIWKLWLRQKMGVSSVEEMKVARYIELNKKGVLEDVESTAISYCYNKTFINGDNLDSSGKPEVIAYTTTGNCYAEEVLDFNLQDLPTTVNLTLYEKSNGAYSLHYDSMPFSGYYHTVEFSPHAMKSAGIQNSLCESMLVLSKKFMSLPFLSNSVQQFSMWIQSAHRVLSKENHQNFSLSFTFDTQHALSFCHCKNNLFDLIYTSNLMDHLSPPNLILSAMLILKKSGLLFSSTLLYKSFSNNLDEFINTCFAFDCKLLPVVLGIRCINHEGAGYTSPVVSEPNPPHIGDMLKGGKQHYKKLMFQKVWAQSLVLPKLPPIESGNITDAMFNSVKVFVFSLLDSTGKGIDILNNLCSETAVLILQAFASSVNANVGNYHFWKPLSSALCLEVKMKPYLYSLQTQLLLHKLHMHLVVDEDDCLLCNNIPIEDNLGTFCADVSLPIQYPTPRFIAFIHQYPSSDANYLCKEAVSGNEVHIFDCFDGTVEAGTLKLKFFAPKKFVASGYNVTIGLTYMKTHKDNIPAMNTVILCLPTTGLEDKQIKFAHYAFSPTTSFNQSSSEDSNFGKLIYHVSDGDKMQSQIALSDAAKIAKAQHKLVTSKISSNAIKLLCDKFSYLLTFKYPINYSKISIKFSKAQGIVNILSPRQAYEYSEEKPISITLPDHQLSLPPQHVKHQIMTRHSALQMNAEDRKILNACQRDRTLMPPLLNAKETLTFFFQSQEETYFLVTPPKDLRGIVEINKRLFDYQHRAPAVDLAFYFVVPSSANIVLPSYPKKYMKEIFVDDAEVEVLQKTLTYFANRTNGTCKSACMPNNFEELQQLMIDGYFTRAVVYYLYGDSDECGMDMMRNPDYEMLPAMGPQCECCSRHCPEMKKCSRCKTVQYCSKDCQTKHWPVHRKTCKIVPVQSKTAGATIKDDNAKTSTARGAAIKPADDRMKSRCSYCDSRSDHLKKCTQCGVALYCDTECQKNHWPQHKSECKALSKPSVEEPPLP